MIVSLVRTFILYIAVMIGLRIMGKRQISDLSPNELVVTILVSQIATIPLQDINQPVVNGVISIFLLVILELIISVLTLKFQKIRKIINGGPVIIINQGKIDQTAMERLRLSIEDLSEGLRQQQVFNIDEVWFAIVETDGKLSVLLRPESKNATAKDVGAQLDKSGVPVPVICDGVYQYEFINTMGLTKAEVSKQLSDRNLKLKDVFLMTVDENNKAVVVKKEKSK